jgi:NADP-dependent 3-hydroxy acid dehydrogenase YdfG
VETVSFRPAGAGARQGALAGRTALVTGASSGIGLEVARSLAAAGAWVAMVARGADVLRAAADDVGGHAIPADVSSHEGVHALATYLRELLGDVPDLVVMCAGAFGLAPLHSAEPDELERMLAVNLAGPFLLVRALLPDMLDRRSGHFITIGSVAGRVAFPANGAYSASKFGVRGLHEVLRAEVRGTGVRATLVEPGATDTPLWDPLDPDARDDLPSRAAMLRAGDVAATVLFAAAQPPDVQISSIAVEAAS